jgi:hypothetical protein
MAEAVARDARPRRSQRWLSDAVAGTAHRVDDLDALLDYARTRNDDFAEPLPDSEVVKMASSWWNKTCRGENWSGIGKMVVSTHAEIDSLLLKNQDAYALLQVLRRYHWGRDFHVANALNEKMGWTLRRLQAARQYLVKDGRIIQRKAHTQRSPALFGWPLRLSRNAQ